MEVWDTMEKLGFISRLIVNAAVVSGYTLTSGIGNVRSVAPKPSSQIADTEIWIFAGLSISFRVSVSGWNSTSGTTFIPPPSRARDLVTIAEVGSTRLTPLERVTTGDGSVSRGARAKPNSHVRSLRYWMVRIPWLSPKLVTYSTRN